MSSAELEHTLLPKVLALPVFSSDPLSSNAYATQEILIVLSLTGAAFLHLVAPIAVAVACLLAIVVTSYRQTVRAYPNGGGAYRVSRENLGVKAGLAAGAALLADYVLTVSVSITAGVDAIVSAVHGLEDLRVELALLFIVFVTLANLRGVKEAGTFFAIPTYGFVLSVYVMLITGFVKCLADCPEAESADLPLEAASGLTLFIVLKAFAAGTTALTGVEAISDGVQAFRYPKSKNAAATLAIMAGLAITMFLGISWLAHVTGVRATEHSVLSRSVVADIAHAVFAGGPMFYVVQAMTAGILILAANTAYQDFPRLSSILAQDGFLPRQFENRGDRLVFSNGIVILAALAALLVVLFEANLTRLIQLYLVGVFISFTLSQTGMALRGRKHKERGWRRRVAISGFGAFVTGVVFVIILTTKFAGGAWIVITAIPIVVYTMYSIHRHYDEVAQQLKHPTRRPTDRGPADHHMVILVTRVDSVTARALGYARSLNVADVSAVTFDDTLATEWNRLAPETPLQVIALNGSRAGSLRAHLRAKRAQLDHNDFLTVIVPETLESVGLLEIVRRPGMHRLKASLLAEPGVQVLDIPLTNNESSSNSTVVQEPARNHVIVLVSRLHNGTLEAIEYAQALRPTDIRALTFAVDPEEAEKLGYEWLAASLDVPLEIQESPFRNMGASVRDYIRELHPDGVDRVVTVVIPEFVVAKRRHQLLHGQRALLVKRYLLFEPGVVAVSVPYHLS